MSRQATRARTDTSALVARLGGAPPAGVAKLDQQTVDALVEMIDGESARRERELELQVPAALARLPWPMRKVVGNALIR